MARRIVSMTTLTPTAVADGVTITNNVYPFLIQGAQGSTVQQNKIHEISISGQAASSSSPTFMILSRDSTQASISNAATSGWADSPMDFSTVALASIAQTWNAYSSTPVRGSASHLMNCSLNAFGGVYFWRANKWDECPTTYGSNSSTVSEISLSAFTGGTPGACGFHMIYETL